MSFPDDITTTCLKGTFGWSRQESDATDPMFKIQGLGWVIRKALSVANVSLQLATAIEDGVVTVDLTQIATGGIQNKEKHIFDWKEREASDIVFGKTVLKGEVIGGEQDSNGQARPAIIPQTNIPGNTRANSILNQFLRGEINHDETPAKGWLAETSGVEGLGNDDGAWLHAFTRQNKAGGWTMEQVWGFENLNGQRLWTRRIVAAKGGEYTLVRMFHTFLGQ